MAEDAAKQPAVPGAASPEPRAIGAVNWLGLWTLYKKEVRRFLKVSFQTVLAPVATTLLYMTVFSLAIGARRGDVNGIEFTAFLAPGLVMMGLLNNAFANSSSSLIVAKVQGNTVDFLMPPLSPAELAAGFIGGAMTRGVIVAAATAIVIAPFVDMSIAHAGAVAFYGLSAAAMLSMVGVIAGIWAEKFDHLAVITNFIIMPLAFLSGTFYSIEILPEPFQTISHFNPVFYMIDGFRYGFIGQADGALWIGAVAITAINLALLAASYLVLRTGWRLKT
ncbi:multidrug ABC transporter permease [Marinicauda salina]|uniref:Transport permease protein n=1 Tax=Marinicauda salina TaxID=2135793 RepID=A0A2U2BXY8_9PROT|nr:ABC transporter permease [Marinicauda salina]PWE18834.1 multidrug ABC transporter permease [Marinicauda salina]